MLSAWVPPGMRVKALESEEGIVGVWVEEAGRKRIRWSREGGIVGLYGLCLGEMDWSCVFGNE